MRHFFSYKGYLCKKYGNNITCWNRNNVIWGNGHRKGDLNRYERVDVDKLPREVKRGLLEKML